MADIYKLATGLALATNTNWTFNSDLTSNAPANPPGTSDIAIWQTGSSGGSHTGNLSPAGIVINGALSNITHASGGTITLGASGFSQAVTNSKQWTESGTIALAVGATTQTWVLCNTQGVAAYALALNSATALSGSASAEITVTNAGSTQDNARINLPATQVTGYSGKLILGANTAIQITGTGGGMPSATIQIDGSNTRIRPTTSGNTTTFGALVINENLLLGLSGSASFTITAPVTIGGAGTRTITQEAESGKTTLAGTLSGSNALTVAGRVSGSGIIEIQGSLAGFSAGLGLTTIGTFTLNTTSTYTYSGALSGAAAFTKAGTGTVTLSGNSSGFTGSVTLTSGPLRAAHANALGTGAGVVTVSSGAALELSGGISLARGATITGTGVGSTGALRNISGNNSVGTVTLSGASTIFSSADTLSLSSSSALTGGNVALTFDGSGNIDVTQPINTTTGTVNKNGTGVAILRGAGNYTGVTTVSAGYLGYVGSITASANGSFGNASLAANLSIAAATGIRYYGAGGTFSRAYTFQGGAGTNNRLEADSTATGAITHTSAPTYAVTNVTKTLRLGGSGTLDNTIQFKVTNNGTGAVTLAKEDAGKWVLSDVTNDYSGGTNINGGTLVASIGSWADGAKVTGSGGVSIAANAKIQTLKNGTGITAQRGRNTYPSLTFANNARIRLGG